MNKVIHIRLVGPAAIVQSTLDLLPKHDTDKILRDESFPLDKASTTNIEIYKTLGKDYPWMTLEACFDLVRKHAFSQGKAITINKHAFSGLRDVTLSKACFSWQVCNILKACALLWPTLVYSITNKHGLFELNSSVGAGMPDFVNYDYDNEALLYAVYRANTAPTETFTAIAERFVKLAELAQSGAGTYGWIADKNGGLGNEKIDEYSWDMHAAASRVNEITARYFAMQAKYGDKWPTIVAEAVGAISYVRDKHAVMLNFEYSRKAGTVRKFVFDAALASLESLRDAQE